MTEEYKEREDVKFIILRCAAMVLLLLYALFSIVMYHTPYIAIVTALALLAYAVSKKRVTGIIAALIGVGLLIIVAWQLTPLLDVYLHPDPWETINHSLSGV